jgi:ABC-type multidrug transport system fused ATPase/permease subunit
MSGAIVANASLVLHVVGARARRWIVLSALLRAVERVALVLAALGAARGELASSVGAALGLVAFAAARGVVRGAIGRATREKLHLAAVDALLEGDVLAPGALPDEDAQGAILEGVDAGERLAVTNAPDALGDAIAAVVVASLLIAVEPPRVVAVGGAALALGVGAVALVRKLTQREIERAWEAYVPVLDRLVDLLRGRLEIVAHGLGPRFRAEVHRALAEYGRISQRSERLVALAGRVPIAGAMVAVGLALLVDASMRGILAGQALGEAAVLASALPTFAGLASSLHEVVRTSARLSPMHALVTSSASRARATRPDSGPGAAPVPVPKLPARIVWEKTSFAYPGAAREAISGLDVAWSPGQLLVLVGPNGSGKSTCLRLLLGLARPTGGKITIGGVDLATLDLAALRRKIAYLPQTPCMPERATVRAAMHLVAPEAGDDELRRALERVELWPVLVERAPSEPLDVRAATLSVGQRQRLAIARTLARGAELVLLDEPDANLDAAGVRLVARLVRDLSERSMVAVVAHTPELSELGGLRVDLAAKTGTRSP